MKKQDAVKVCKFIEEHFDACWQEDWFDFCDMLLGIIADDASKGRYAESIAKEFPFFFEMEEKK